ncbi:MAG: N-acetylmuramidase domain-containing protein [Candidatus Gracilibacteria bacterium]|nr:N-acetylmuramidase domain-containing protein [Candidatus Gracilibacteria bacterium]
MYTIKQLKRTFFKLMIFGLFNENVGGGGREVEQKPKEGKKEIDKELTPEQEKIQTLRKELDTLKASKKFVGGMENNLRTRLVKEGDPKDKEFQELADKVKRYQAEIKNISGKEEGISKELSDLLSEINNEIQKTVSTEKKEDFIEVSKLDTDDLKTISNKEFLKIPAEQRLQHITKNNVSSEKVASGEIKDLEFTFKFNGKFNRDLYLETTAGQVLPKEVGEVKVGGKTYTRSNVGGEFFTSENSRLIIRDGTKIELGELRTADDLEKISKQNLEKSNSFLESNPNASPEIVNNAISRGIDPKFAIITFSGLIEGKDGDESRLILEDAFTEFDRQRGKVEASNEMVNGKYDENLSIGLMKHFNQDSWKEKAEQYGYKKEEVENYEKISNTKIDFSSLETGDIAGMIDKTSNALGVKPEMVKAILKQESGGNMSATRFEKHVYDRELRKGRNSDEAKLLSTSFGGFQIMGFNYKVCGYDSVTSYVEAMKNPENQFNAFANFVKANGSLHNAMKGNTPDFQTIARYYNGPNYAQNNYDRSIEKHFYA